jgi:hypothetical protein
MENDNDQNHLSERGFTGMVVELDVKGMSISIIDNTP